MEQRVLVTGANGFLGSHVVKQLLLAGYRVRGTLRNIEDRGDIVTALNKLVPDAKYELELVDVDILKDEGWDSAMSGCSSVIHTAGPVTRVSEDISGDILLDHSVNGALRVLKAAVEAGVKKVVMTSAITAVFCLPMPIEEEKVYTEKDWTDLDIPNLEVYSKAKTVAEKAAWDFVAKLPADKLSLTMLLPSCLIGPLLIKPSVMGFAVESLNIVMNHVYPGSPNLLATYSDVRDVAECHVKALTTPAAEGQRIIHLNEASFLPDTAKMIADEFRPQGYTIYATNNIPAFFFWLNSLFDKRIVQSGVLDRINKEFVISNEKFKDIFGTKLRPLNDSLIDMIYSMVDFGLTFKANKYKQVGSRAVLKAE